MTTSTLVFGGKSKIGGKNIFGTSTGGSNSPVTFVQISNGGFGNASGSTIPLGSATWPSNSTAGNAIGVCGFFASTVTITSITDDNSNTYNLLNSLAHTYSYGAATQFCYLATNISVSVTPIPNITVNFSGTPAFGNATFFEIAGAIASPLGNTNTNGCNTGGSCGSSPISMTSGAISSETGSFVLIWGQTDGGTIAVSSPWTNMITAGQQAIGYQANVSTGSFNGAMTDTGANNDSWSMMITEIR